MSAFSILRGRRYPAVVIALGFVAAPLAARAAEESLVLLRERPLDVSWGEIALVEANRVDVPTKDGPKTFANALGLEFSLRNREERTTPGGGDNAEVQSSARTIATFRIAAEIDGGDAAWREYREALAAEVARLSPASYERFLEQVGSRTDLMKDRPFRAISCVTRSGDDVARQAELTIDANGGRTGNFSTVRDPVPVCAALAAGLRYAPRIDQRTSAMAVFRARVERITVNWVQRPAGEFAALPAGASLERKPAVAGKAGYSASRSSEGFHHHEQQVDDGAGGGEYVAVAEARDAEIPPAIMRARSAIARWAIRTDSVRYGPEPVQALESEHVLYEGLFLLSAPAGPLDVVSYGRAVGFDLADRAGQAAADLPQALDAGLTNRLLASVLVVTCHDAAGDGNFAAEYCVAHACARVSNADALCDEMRRAFTAPAN